MITVYEVLDLEQQDDPLVVELDPFTAARKVKELNEVSGLDGSSARFVYCPKQVASLPRERLSAFDGIELFYYPERRDGWMREQKCE